MEMCCGYIGILAVVVSLITPVNADILVSPTIASGSDRYTAEGKRAYLSCIAASTNGHTYSWRLNGREVSTSNVYSFDATRELNQKQITCRVTEKTTSNEATAAYTIRVAYMDMPLLYLPAYKVFYGDRVTISCVSTGANPATLSYTIYKEWSPVFSATSSGTYVIDKLQLHDSASYSCSTSNEYVTMSSGSGRLTGYEDDGGIGAGWIVAICLGSLILVLAVITVICVYCRRRRKRIKGRGRNSQKPLTADASLQPDDVYAMHMKGQAGDTHTYKSLQYSTGVLSNTQSDEPYLHVLASDGYSSVRHENQTDRRGGAGNNAYEISDKDHINPDVELDNVN